MQKAILYVALCCCMGAGGAVVCAGYLYGDIGAIGLGLWLWGLAAGAVWLYMTDK